jgi:hypothetical protein
LKIISLIALAVLNAALNLSLFASGQTVSGPISTPQVNSYLYVGAVPGYYPNIQSAVTAGCAMSGNREVIIPPGYTGMDTPGGVTGACTTVFIGDIHSGFPEVCYTDQGGSYSSSGVSCSNGSGGSSLTALTGDVTATGPGSAAATLATVNSGPGACGDSTHVCAVTTNGKGLVTAQSAVAIAGGGTVNVNGSPVSSPNFNSTLPAAPAGSVNIPFLASGSNVSASVPLATDTVQGVMQPDGTTMTCTAGVCSSNSGVSARIKYLSQSGCAAQNTDLNIGGGTDDTACINSILATASATNPILLYQDGKSLISGNGVQGPAGGNWGIAGYGGGITTVNITNATLSGGTATFVTTANNLVAGQYVTLNNFTGGFTSLNGQVLAVLSSGLTSTGFEVAASGSSTSAAQTATAKSLYGTGFYFASGSTGTVISNGSFPTSANCAVPNGPVPSRGANISFSDFVFNGNFANNPQYCFGIHIKNINGLTVDNVLFYNATKFSLLLDNVGQAVVTNSKFITSNLGAGTNTDGIHIDGPANDIAISNIYAQTGDDVLALNSIEGYCGAINRVAWVNSTIDNSYNVLRAYNDNLAACGNGLVPLIDTVDIDNVSGTVYEPKFAIFGAAITGLGSLNPAITNIHWNNSTIKTTNAGSPGSGSVWLIDNLGTISFSNFTFDSPNTLGVFEEDLASATGYVGSLTLNNFRINRTASGSTVGSLFYQAGAGVTAIGALNLNGVGIVDSGGSYSPLGCLLCAGVPGYITAAVTNVSNIDYSHVVSLLTSVFYPSDFLDVEGPFNFYNTTSGAENNIVSKIPYLGTWSINDSFQELSLNSNWAMVENNTSHRLYMPASGIEYWFDHTDAQIAEFDEATGLYTAKALKVTGLVSQPCVGTDGSGNLQTGTCSGGSGTVTSVATSAPLSGGPITTTGTIACPTCVTSAAGLTLNQLMLGGGSQASAKLGSLGTTTTVLHGNASGAPSFGAVTASDAPTLATLVSPAFTTPNIGAATGTSLLVTGIVAGTAPVTITTTSTATLGGTYKYGYTFNNEGTTSAAVTYTLPTAAAGQQYCVRNLPTETGTLTLQTSASGQFIGSAGAYSASGGYVISAGALADAACVVGVDSTHWVLYPQGGTWSTH